MNEGDFDYLCGLKLETKNTLVLFDMEEKILMDLFYQSMQDSAREARLSLGRPSSQATREEALQQVAMLKAAKDAAQPIGR